MLYVCDKDKIFVVARRDWENWSIYTLDLKQPRLIPVVDTPFNEISISFAGDNLYFAANYDNINRIYAYNLKDNQLYKLTNDGYANYPVVDITTNTLYFVGLTSVGFDIFYKELNPERFILPKYKKSTMPVIPYHKTTRSRVYR
jgi:Tol biopolymer transport system component